MTPNISQLNRSGVPQWCLHRIRNPTPLRGFLSPSNDMPLTGKIVTFRWGHRCVVYVARFILGGRMVTWKGRCGRRVCSAGMRRVASWDFALVNNFCSLTGCCARFLCVRGVSRIASL